eukprot:CAMPEP_0118902866 /NCGR_PEP_ID=MMETSP1166-20130328/7961_1 /TAXON_ID=1104430 /ORGANISM="Chrysoreinhardia sp, Strain CCMP3193" /LENGTH=640 /DNA_ID=CAMNT_0006842081 /DNA_START=1 /DNA_END=1923 /DNA_ORIENTATION=+
MSQRASLFIISAVSASRRIVVSNKYSHLGPIGEGYPWAARGSVVDAYAPFEARLDPPETSKAIEWNLDVNAGLAPGEYVLRASTGETTVVYSTYVRRELRELDDEDRERYANATRVLYATSTERGREIYGSPKFLGLDALVTLHHEAAAQRDADHMHQGQGFLANHAKLTKLFEDSLRTVDKRVSVPYWDSTIEMAAVEQGDLDSAFDSDLWTAKWFGSIGRFYNGEEEFLKDPTSEEWAIQDGPFAFLAAMTPEDAAWGRSELLPRNAYGLLRAPWNNNPSPYVSRFPSWGSRLPDCETHRLFAESPTDSRGGESWVDGNADRAKWMYDVSNEPHGPLHNSPGGMWPVSSSEGSSDASDLLESSFGIKDVKQHTLWRFHVLEFPDHCPPWPLGSEIRSPPCGGPRCALEKWDGNLTAVGYEIVKAQGHLPSEASLSDWRSRPADLDAVADIYCRAPEMLISGEAKDSGGSIEPSFWPIHPAITRLYQYRILFGPPFKDPDTWPTEGACFGARSADVDPDRLAFSAVPGGVAEEGVSEEGVSASPFFAPAGLEPCGFASCCGGHFARSRLYAGDEEIGLTNEETLDLIDPRARRDDGIVYHHFRFPHCDEIGVPFLTSTSPEEAVTTTLKSRTNDYVAVA